MCLSEPDNNRACLFDTDNVWQWQCLNHPALQIQIQTQWIQIQYIHIYSYIHIFVRIVFQIKRLFWSGLQIFQSIFSQFSEVYVFFRIFDIFQIFNFCTIIFTNFLEYFSEWSARIFFRIYQSFFSKFWRSISLNFEYLS